MVIVSVGFMSGQSRQRSPYKGSRVFWGLSSQKEIFPSGNYARIIQLQDKRLMAVCESGGIMASYSSNGGNTWSAPEKIVQSAPDLPAAVPDLIQLSDGTILVGYNPRPSKPYSTERRFGIRLVRSTDNGKTWSDSIFVYDASHTFEDGCWEPSFLQLPSGEIHLYFANEAPFTTSNEQEISLCRSFDGGITWGEKERVCYRAGSRDGMPSAIITDNDEIVVILEDNGHPGQAGFRATTVRCALDDNWKNWVDANSEARSMIFPSGENRNHVSAAPYIRKLKNGETIASWQGNHDRPGVGEKEYVMYVAVGDSDGKNFKAVTQPFGIPRGQNGLWNSVSVGDDGSVFAVTSWNEGHGPAINIIKGYVMDSFEANFGTPVVNASFSDENWTRKNAQQVYMGVTTRNRATMDFLYDNENLYFFGRVVDRTIHTDKIDNDGIFLYLDTQDCCDNYPQKGMYRLFLNVDGNVEFSYGENNKWVAAAQIPDDMRYEVKIGRTYYDMEIAIPWSALGLDAAPVGLPMRCNIEVRDRRDAEIVTEKIPETNGKQSWSWPGFKLNPSGEAALESIGISTKAGVSLVGSTLMVSSESPLDSVNVFSMTGELLASKLNCGECVAISLPVEREIIVVEIRFVNGARQYEKMLIS